jgi:hypothetical protein
MMAAPNERVSEVQKNLGQWRGRELPALHNACVAIGRLVGNGVLTYMLAYQTVLQSAETRGYFRQYDSDDVAECIESSLKSGLRVPKT